MKQGFIEKPNSLFSIVNKNTHFETKKLRKIGDDQVKFESENKSRIYFSNIPGNKNVSFEWQLNTNRMQKTHSHQNVNKKDLRKA